jgi:hypothetical protein
MIHFDRFRRSEGREFFVDSARADQHSSEHQVVRDTCMPNRNSIVHAESRHNQTVVVCEKSVKPSILLLPVVLLRELHNIVMLVIAVISYFENSFFVEVCEPSSRNKRD